MNTKPATRLIINCGRKLSNSPPNNTLNPFTTKKADIAPKNIERADDLEESITVHICVLSPNSARRTMEKEVKKGIKFTLFIINF